MACLAKLCAAAVFVPWATMYITCLMVFYALDPKRKANHDIPYISGLLGDGKDGHELMCARLCAWLSMILVTVVARIVADRTLVKWMAGYYGAWALCVVTAMWDAHEETNPLGRFGVRGDIAHFAASVAFFAAGGTESFCLNLRKMYPGSKGRIKVFMIGYIVAYCLLFFLNKRVSGLSFLGHGVLPCFEHLMLFGHVSVDTLGTARRLGKPWRRPTTANAKAVPW